MLTYHQNLCGMMRNNSLDKTKEKNNNIIFLSFDENTNPYS